MQRRSFSTLLAVTGAVTATRPMDVFSAVKRTGSFIPADRKLRIAVVGCGAQGNSDMRRMQSEEIVAICDPCRLALQNAAARAPGARQYTDFRVMLKEMDREIDAVIVATPEHMHFQPALAAIQMGKHVYVEKPLTHTVWEARQLQEAAEMHQVVTQMGNHGHAYEGCRQAKEYIEADLIGDVKEVHVWTDKPTPHGKEEEPNPWWPYEITATPSDRPPVPDTLDWNLWLGAAPSRPYHPVYHPKRWRRFHDFGTGSLGDMGCHVMDAAFYALSLGYPDSVIAESPAQADGLYPNKEKVTWTFGARGSMPPLTMHWYGGAWEVPALKFLGDERLGPKGGALVGEKGMIMWSDDYCKSARILPRDLWVEINEKGLRPEPTIARVPKGDARMEFVNACKGGPMPGSCFSYSAPLTEMVLLGNIAIRNNGKRLEWDGKNLQITNDPKAQALVTKQYRSY